MNILGSFFNKILRRNNDPILLHTTVEPTEMGAFGGWGPFVIEHVNSTHKAVDAYGVTEDGDCNADARLYVAIQQRFQERGHDVSIATIRDIEIVSRQHPDYYTQLAFRCRELEF